MLSKNQTKLINSLQQKKYRFKHGFFIAEGIKVVEEFLNSNHELEKLFCTNENYFNSYNDKLTVVSEAELKKISSLSTPNKVLGIFKIPKPKPIESKGLIVALDGINDPGNLGTIIRLCDWFGVHELICSKNTVDCYNTKVVQSSMGSLTRVNINYVNLPIVLNKTNLPVFGAFMDGESVYSTKLPTEGILIMGNEANGISNEINELIKNRISIPRFGAVQKTESLNVATATAILLNEFRRV